MAGTSERTRTHKVDLGAQVKLRPADPFDLIRWLARSQSDPRKAVAELVQNSLDAGATEVEVARRRIKGQPVLSVRDNGEGVLPTLDREEALRYIASHIGHSRKMNLTLSERRDRVIAGKYGVGLLGFWSVGKRFELRSRVGRSVFLALRLEEDEEAGQIVRLPLRTDLPDTFTEVVISGVHDSALRALGGARLASYLGSELRGQLLSREVKLTVHDAMARGSAQQHFDVHPRRYLGEAMDLPAELAVVGYAPARVELYVSRAGESPAIQLACAGTVVADDFRELDALGLAVAPWVGSGLTGVIDFPDLNVPPGTRRGVVPDDVAQALASVLASELSPRVTAELERLEQERQIAAQRDVARDLRKALRGLARRLPQYELPGGKASDGVARPASDNTSASSGSGAAAADSSEPVSEPPAHIELFPPGELASVELKPSSFSVPAGGERRIRLRARDTDGRVIDRPLEIEWLVDGHPCFELRGEGRRPALAATADAPLAATATVFARVREGNRTADASARATIVEPDPDNSIASIPEPEFVNDPAGAWRSRLTGSRWQVNEAHEDYIALRSEPRARLRYLLSLFAKEVVNRSFGIPGSDDLLERIVEILAHAERNLRGA